jgi:hypothetical protein
MARADASTSRNVDSLIAALAEVDEHGHTSGYGHQLAQEFQPLCPHLRREKIGSRQVAARPTPSTEISNRRRGRRTSYGVARDAGFSRGDHRIISAFT